MATDKVWVVAESSGGAPSSLTQELLSKARSMGSVVEAVAWGGDVASTAGELGNHGATKVYDLGDLGDALPGGRVAAAIAAQIEAGNTPDVILIGTTYDGRDIAGRLSAKIDRPVLTNLVDLTVEDGVPVAHHAIFGGVQMAKSRFTGDGPGIFVVRAKSFAAEPAGGSAAEVVPVEVPDTGPADAARVLERHVEERTGPQLDEAEIVVSGGRGLGQADNYEMIEELAKLLKAAPGASRAIVDAGWVPYAYQVGQTGKTVKPTVYLAAGISGATQHMVGMKGAKNIIAINKDQEAPIFSIADLGVVGDVHKVLPKLIEALKARG
ncbi:MAG TPA: electron transfer flavoprotein subunit alpha/FixB family protein [Acidimicrobiales bacterium]|jgi:electron transfer flavoprotein alpha subunit|nr:electron transfer flavoprotein subunit alpha/FixB family protein [Acidimicrobiales bacterium]